MIPLVPRPMQTQKLNVKGLRGLRFANDLNNDHNAEPVDSVANYDATT